MVRKKNERFYCSFCGKNQSEVVKLIGGPSVSICDECITLCTDILKEEVTAGTAEAKVGKGETELGATPKEIHAYLDQYVIQQERAKRVLSLAVYNHYKRLCYIAEQKKQGKSSRAQEVEIEKSNILLIGPTGSGKTLLARRLAKHLNVPFVIVDATTLTQAGYVGEDVDNMVLKMLEHSDYDVERAQRGIVYIDEIDKIAKKMESASLTRDVSGEGVQQALLKLVEGTIVTLSSKGSGSSRRSQQMDSVRVDTTNILFIAGGAFASLEHIINARSEEAGIGFAAKVRDRQQKQCDIGDLLRQVQPRDLIKFGLIPEFVGRFPIVVTLCGLNKAALIAILTEPKNALIKQFKQLFHLERDGDGDGVALEVDAEAVAAIAELALKRDTGARGLRAIMEEVLLDTMYELPSMRQEIEQVCINAAVVKGQAKPVLMYKNRRKGKKKHNE